MELPCLIHECGTLRGITTAARKEHCQHHHGYPNCLVCHRVIKNINMFEEHMQHPHEKKLCQLCLQLVVVGTEKRHTQDVHGFPACPFCKRNFLAVNPFASHVLQHVPVQCGLFGCELTFYKGAEQEKEHYASCHGFATCPTCNKWCDNIINFVTHVKQCAPQPCLFPSCEAMFSGRSDEREHYASCHGFPTCPTCNKWCDNIINFVAHVKQCAPQACLFPSCKATFSGRSDEREHYASCHRFPLCGICGKVCDNHANFAIHMQQCVARTCFYPGCTGMWTVDHLLDDHDDLRCCLCDKEKTSTDQLAKHLQTCGPKFACAFKCDKCGAVCQTSTLLQRHICLPPLPLHLKPEEYFRLTEAHCTQLEVVNQRDKTQHYHVTARIRKSTVGYLGESVRELSKRQLKTLKLDQDPSALEVMEPGTLPLPMFFMPTHCHFELRTRMLYELESAQPAWSFWLMLVYRVMNYCTDPTGCDILWYQEFLKTVLLPLGVPDECQHLLVVRARVKDMWTRARKHRHIKVFVSSINGKKHVLRRQLRRLDDAVRASKRAKGLSDENSLEECSDEDARMLFYDAHGADVEVDEPGAGSTSSTCLVESKDVPIALTEIASIPIKRRVASAREVEWQELLHNFVHNVLKPVIRSKQVYKLQSWTDVKSIFFDQALFMVENGPECQLPDYMQHFMTKILKLEQNSMQDVSLQPHVRMPDAWDSEDEAL